MSIMCTGKNETHDVLLLIYVLGWYLGQSKYEVSP